MGLHTNWHKTKIQNIGIGYAPRTVHIYNQAVETVSRFTYLGSDIDSDGNSYPEIHRRQQRLSLSIKLRIYTSLLQWVVSYGCETWTMCKVDCDRIQSFHMQALRRSLGIRWYDKVSNAVVNERTKLPDRQTSFIIWSHLSPTGEHTCFAGTATVNRSPHRHSWKCPPGCPRTNWLQQVEENIGLSVGAARIAGQDRSMWRTL